MFKKIKRFTYLTFQVTKLFLDYKRMYNESDDEKLKELGIHLREKFQEFGPTFVKFGQMLSLQYDLLHPTVCKELRKLLDQEHRIDFKKIKPILRRNYGSVKRIFKEFDENPIASASVAQVHRAKLKPGENVIVKVRKPHVKERFKEDIEILYFIAKILSKLPKANNLNLVKTIEKFSDITEKELNFAIEGKNIERFRKSHECFKFVKIPKVYWDLTTEEILVTDFFKGVSLNEVITAIENDDKALLKKMKKDNIDLNIFIKRYPEVLLKQVFEDGFFNADPHPANIILLPDNEIGLIDFGIIDELSEEELSHLFIGVLGFLENDVDSLVDLVVKIGKTDKKDLDMELVRKKVIEVMGEARKTSISEIRTVDLTHKFSSLFYRTGLKLPSEFVALGREFAILDGVADIISPDFNLMEVLKPLCNKMIKKDIKKKFSHRRLLKGLSRVLAFTEQLPDTIDGILTSLKKNKFEIVVKHEVDEKKNDRKLKIFILMAISASISLFISIWGDFTAFDKGLRFDVILAWLLFFPFIFFLLYSLTRKKLNL